MPIVKREGIELAKVGSWNASTGKWNCTRKQLADAVRADQSKKFRPAILKRGHIDPRFAGDAHVSADGEPALGQARNLRLSEDGDSLIGDVLMPDWLDDELDAIYPSRSVEADLGVETPDGESFDMVLTGVALLGVTKPAIPSLAELPERIAASEYTAAFSVAAGFFDEESHPRGAKGSSSGGKFVSAEKGDGQKGKEGKAGQVKEVQAELLRLGLLSEDSGKNGGKDGMFGDKTEAAVKKWQRAHGHKETGKVSADLLAELKKAKKGDLEKAQAETDKKTTTDASKTKDGKPKYTPAGDLVIYPKDKTSKAKRVKAAAAAAAPAGLDIREITSDTVVYDDPEGRVWVSTWKEQDDEIVVSPSAPAVARYETIAASAAGMAAHSMSLPICSGRGWDSGNITASLGDTSVSIAPAVREALGFDESADEEAVNAALLQRLQTPAVEPAPIVTEPVIPAPTKTSPVTPVIPAAQDGRSDSDSGRSESDVEKMVADKVAAALAPIQASHVQYEAKISDLSTELAQRKADEALAVKTQILASALQDGKIAPADKDQWASDYDESPKVTTRILASLKPGTAFPISASGYAGDPETAPSDEDDAFAAIMGWTK